MPAPTDNRAKLTLELELRRLISIQQAAELKAISVDSFRRHFRHLIVRVSPRRLAVRLGDVLAPERMADDAA